MYLKIFLLVLFLLHRRAHLEVSQQSQPELNMELILIILLSWVRGSNTIFVVFRWNIVVPKWGQKLTATQS